MESVICPKGFPLRPLLPFVGQEPLRTAASSSLLLAHSARLTSSFTMIPSTTSCHWAALRTINFVSSLRFVHCRSSLAGRKFLPVFPCSFRNDNYLLRTSDDHSITPFQYLAVRFSGEPRQLATT